MKRALVTGGSRGLVTEKSASPVWTRWPSSTKTAPPRLKSTYEFGLHDEQPHDTSRLLGEFARDGLELVSYLTTPLAAATAILPRVA